MTGQQLKRARKALGIDQVTVAKRLGVHPMTISKWERGVVPIPKATGELVHLWVKARRAAPKEKQ